MTDKLTYQIAALEILNSELRFKYPQGSVITLQPVENSNPIRFSVNWYDKVGAGFPLNNIVRAPEEWSSLTAKEMTEIASRFDSAFLLPRVRNPSKELEFPANEAPVIKFTRVGWRLIFENN